MICTLHGFTAGVFTDIHDIHVHLQEASKLHLDHRHSCTPYLLKNFNPWSRFQGGQDRFALLRKDFQCILHRFARDYARQVQVRILTGRNGIH